jgi:hypothetical protein
MSAARSVNFYGGFECVPAMGTSLPQDTPCNDDVTLMVSVFNKTIPTVIEYASWGHDELIRQLNCKHPELEKLPPEVYNEKIKQHETSFIGRIIDDISDVVLRPIFRPFDLRATTLEFDHQSFHSSSKSLSFTSDHRITFKVKVTWEKVFSYETVVCGAGRNAHTVYQAKSFRLAHTVNANLVQKIVTEACRILTNRTVHPVTHINPATGRIKGEGLSTMPHNDHPSYI